MNRRQLMLAASAFAAGRSLADEPKVQSMDGALLWLDRLEKARTVQTTGEWPMIAVLEHLAQSIEMSMDGFPQPDSEFFQQMAGTVVFTFFEWTGVMSHDLAEPIPGAPALTLEGNWRKGSARLRTALVRFDGYSGTLQPHFAYGRLDKKKFARAHALHIANHQDEVVVI
jgi:Protein of unknown function (DUF1569)